jgi:hypothetical protein
MDSLDVVEDRDDMINDEQGGQQEHIQGEDEDQKEA